MIIYKIFFRSIAMVIMVMILSDCRQSYYIARNTGRNIMTLSDHQRAKSALNANDLNAAQGYLTGEKYNNRYRPVSGEESWGSLQYRAAKIVANAAANGRKVRDDALYLAYISLFEAEEGVPEHPDIMLGYMHKAMALLLANPQLLDKIDSKNVSTLPLNAMLYGNIYTMAARLTGPKKRLKVKVIQLLVKAIRPGISS